MKAHAQLLWKAFALLLLGCSDVSNGGNGNDASVAMDAGQDAIEIDVADVGMTDDTTDVVISTDAIGSDAMGSDVQWIDPNCTDGLYRETIHPNSGSIESIVFNPNHLVGYYRAVLNVRHPDGVGLLNVGFSNSGGRCVSDYAGNPTTANRALRRLGLVLHECGHATNLNLSTFNSNTYVISPALSLTGSMGDTTTRNGMTFARSWIRVNGAPFNMLWAPCNGNTGNCDVYADNYLHGDPTDNEFQGGDQGFNLLMEELVQYINTLVASYAVADAYGSASTSARDGVLAFLWYTERYLKMGREDFPDAYAFIISNPSWRTILLTLWGRAWLYLNHTQGHSAMGLYDDTIEPLVMDPNLLQEIQRVRVAHGCGR